jgi:hypothetical protein
MDASASKTLLLRKLAMKYLLREFYQLCADGSCQDLLSESEKEHVRQGGMYLVGKIQEAGAINGNGRTYSEQILAREIKNYQKLIRENRAVGELDHPETSVVELSKVSHMMTEVWWDGKSVMGKIKVLDTPSGKTLRSLIDSGVQVGISSRGTGSVSERNGVTVVEDDFNLICFDIVSDPSTKGAFMQLAEAKNNLLENQSKADKLNRLINDIVSDL